MACVRGLLAPVILAGFCLIDVVQAKDPHEELALCRRILNHLPPSRLEMFDFDPHVFEVYQQLSELIERPSARIQGNASQAQIERQRRIPAMTAVSRFVWQSERLDQQTPGSEVPALADRRLEILYTKFLSIQRRRAELKRSPPNDPPDSDSEMIAYDVVLDDLLDLLIKKALTWTTEFESLHPLRKTPHFAVDLKALEDYVRARTPSDAERP